MPDEELNQEEVTDVASREAEAEQTTETPAFDPDAERAKIRQELEGNLRAEMEAKYRPQEPVKQTSEEIPDRWADPEAYDAYRDKKLTEQILSQVAPLLNVVNTNTVEQRIRNAGVGDEGLKYIKDTLGPGLNATMDDKSFDFVVKAAKFVDSQKPQPTRLTPERPYGERQTLDITPAERELYGIGTKGGPTEEEVRRWKKEEMETTRR